MSADAQSTADSKYVESHLETVLTKLLAELYLIKPSDPGMCEKSIRITFILVAWLANALRQYARQEERNGVTALET